MTTTIKITELSDIGNGLANSTLVPVVDMSGTPTTERANLNNLSNFVLNQGTGANLGDVANITITGGSDGYVLQTDGAGTLSWTAQTGGGGNGTPGGSNTQIQFNDAGSFGGNTGFTFNKTTGILTSPFVAGNGNGLSNIQGANVSGAVSYATTANSVAAANVSGLGNLALLSKDGNASNVLHGDGSWSADTTTYGNSNVASYLPTYTGNIGANIVSANKISSGELYSFSGVIVENADLTHGATAALQLPNNANTTSPIQITNSYGNIQLTTGITAGSLKNFTFDNAGNLSTPGNIIATNQLRGTSVYVTSTGTAINASSGNILTNEVTGTKFNFLNGSYTATITGGGATSNYSLNLPATAGTNGQVLTTDGTGNLSWSTGGGSANTGNVTFDNVTVQGVSGFGLQLSPSPDDTANLKYLQVRAGDVDSHIHFDTGDNTTYDQYFGDDNKYVKLEAGTSGNIVIGTDSNGKNWTFGDNGNLSVPGSITSILSGGFPFGGAITNVTTGNPTVIVTLDSSPFPDAVTGLVTITGVQGATQANGTRYYRAVEANEFQLFNDAACTIPTSGIGWGTYISNGFAYSPEYNDLELKGDTVDIRTGDSIFHFTPTGDIQMPGGAYASGGYGRLLTNNGYTTLLSYGTDAEHGGPELDWSDASDVGNVFGNSNVVRNTLYLNDGGLYVGLNENNNANAVTASWRFDRYGALNLPSGNATPIQRGQILSSNENGFINLDVQFGVEPGLEGGVRLGTGATKPVDLRAGSNEWRFDSDSSLTVPGIIKSIGSYVYRGFYAVLNQISGNDPSINQIVLSRSSSISGSNPTTDTDDDNFIVTGINGSNITAIVNLYGTSTSVPLNTEDLFSFIRNYIDVVLYNGNTQRTTIGDIQTAFATNEASLLAENFTSGTIVNSMNFNGIQALFQVNSFTHTGSGTGAVFLFDCDPLATGSVDYNSIEWNYNSCYVPGTGYQVGDTITVPGTELGGATPADDMTITVSAINGSGGIVDYSVTGTMSQASYEQNFVKRYIYDGVSDAYDQGNFLGTDISRCVFTAYTDSNSNLVVTSVTSGSLLPYMVFYEPTNQTYPMVVWQTDGLTEGGTGTYVCGGYDTIASNLPSRTYTAYGMYYGVGVTVTSSNENWGAGTYGTMVGSNGNGIFSMVSLDGTASTVSYAGNTGSDSDGTKAAISQFAIGADPQPLNLVSNTSTWTFGTDGNLTVPGNINAAATGSFSINDVISAITTGSTNVYVTLPNTVFPGPVTGKIAISGVVGTVEANQTWWFQAAEVNDIQLFTDSALTIPANGTNWLPYLGGGRAASVTYDNLVIGAGALTLGNPNRQWTIFEDGNIVAQHNTASIIGANGLAVEVAPGNSLTNVINVPVDQTFTGSWSTATYSANSGTGRIDIVDATGGLRRFVQLYMQNANQGTALVTINDSVNSLSYNGFEYIGNTFTIYVVQSPGVTPITVTTMRLDAVMRNAMELNDDTNQLNIESNSGWSVNITSGYQGDVNINAGDDIFINAGNKATGDNTGGQLGFNGGNGGDADSQDPAGNGGGIDMVAGDGGVASNSYGAGNGGYTFVSGGNGGGANATGSHNAGIGGSLVLYAGNAGSNDGNQSLGQEGGNVEIQAGSASGDYTGGFVSITAGNGGTTYGSGNIRLTTQASDNATNNVWEFANDGRLTFPRVAGNNDPIAYIEGGATPSISSIDYSLAGPANFQIQSNYMKFTGYTGAAVTIYADDGKILGDANLVLTTNNANVGNTLNWTHDTTGNLTLPTISTGSSTDEQTIVRSQRKIIPPFRYSAVIDGNTPTVVYTASSVNITSMKVTMQIQHTGLGMELFDVYATFVGSTDTYYTVSNRVAPPTIDNSNVVVSLNGSNQMQITVTIYSGAATSWVTYDSTEFGIAVD